tara:strand:+ start:4249 stop:4551 length:303 start_codon:yes stop_codon:yes gene_type:complete
MPRTPELTSRGRAVLRPEALISLSPAMRAIRQKRAVARRKALQQECFNSLPRPERSAFDSEAAYDKAVKARNSEVGLIMGLPSDILRRRYPAVSSLVPGR